MVDRRALTMHVHTYSREISDRSVPLLDFLSRSDGYRWTSVYETGRQAGLTMVSWVDHSTSQSLKTNIYIDSITYYCNIVF